MVCGLDHMHRIGAIHCDVKPANILLRETQGTYVVLLGDLGCAAEAHHGTPTVV